MINIRYIKELMNKNKISIYKLSKITCINEAHLGKVLKGRVEDPRISTVKAIAKALEVDINEII